MFSHRIRINSVEYSVLLDHLASCSELFDPPLSTYVDIPEYSRKIKENSTTVEYWIKKKLAGVVAVYYNDLYTKTGFITNISVIKEYHGMGIATKLLSRTIKIGKKAGFSILRLEVRIQNCRAIQLYQKHGFVDVEKNGDLVCMEMKL